MALTLAKITPTGSDFVAGNKRVKYVTVTFDSSYATGGESLTPADVGLKVITHVTPDLASVAAHTTGVLVGYDYTNKKLFAMTNTASGNSGVALSEVASTTNLSTFIVRLRIEGW